MAGLATSVSEDDLPTKEGGLNGFDNPDVDPNGLVAVQGTVKRKRITRNHEN